MPIIIDDKEVTISNLIIIPRDHRETVLLNRSFSTNIKVNMVGCFISEHPNKMSPEQKWKQTEMLCKQIEKIWSEE